jgi:hypothetical protein
MANLQIMTMSLRAASQKGKSVNVDGQAKPENLPVFHWDTKASGNITLAAHRGFKKSSDGNLVTFTAKKDMTIKAGTDILALCLARHGDTEVLRVQKDFEEAKIGELSASALKERARRALLATLRKDIPALLALFTAEQVVQAMVAKGEHSEALIEEAVATVVKQQEEKSE